MTAEVIALKMRGVLSSFIVAIGWEDGVLEIWMKGYGYRYRGVTEEQYRSLFINSDFGRNYGKLKPYLPMPERIDPYPPS